MPWNCFACAWVLFLPLAVWSCATSSELSGPPVSLPAQFSEAGEEALPERWWFAFHDPTLNNLMARALQGNFDLLSAWDRLDQAAARAGIADAGLWPSLELETGVGYGFSKEARQADIGFRFEGRYEIDIWGRVRGARDAARADYLASREALHAASLTLSAAIATTWYRLVAQRGELTLLIQQDGVNRQVLELVTLRFRSGGSKAVDVLQQRQLIESNRGSQAEVRAQIEILEHQLAILLGLPPGKAVAEQLSTLIDLPALPQTGLPAELIQRRPDVQAAYLRLQAADSRVGAAIAERLPRLSILPRATTSAPNPKDLLSNWLVNLGANLFGPIFDGGRRKAEVDLASAKASEALHEYGKVVLTALQEIEDALAKERHYKELRASLAQQITLSEEVIGRTRENYTKGAETFLRVLDAMLTHQALQRAELRAHLELIHSRIALCNALGGGWKLTRGGEEVEPDRQASWVPQSESRARTSPALAAAGFVAPPRSVPHIPRRCASLDDDDASPKPAQGFRIVALEREKVHETHRG